MSLLGSILKRTSSSNLVSDSKRDTEMKSRPSFCSTMSDKFVEDDLDLFESECGTPPPPPAPSTAAAAGVAPPLEPAANYIEVDLDTIPEVRMLHAVGVGRLEHPPAPAAARAVRLGMRGPPVQA